MFKKILVATDGSSLSAKLLESAIAFAKIHNSSMVAVTVAEPRLFNSTDPVAQTDGDIHEAQNRQQAQSHLEQFVTAAAKANVVCEPVVTQSATPADEIVKVARHYECDIIFMATRAKFGVLEKILNESHTHSVLEKTSIPVLVFP